jgi:hypothetical protein
MKLSAKMGHPAFRMTPFAAKLQGMERPALRMTPFAAKLKGMGHPAWRRRLWRSPPWPTMKLSAKMGHPVFVAMTGLAGVVVVRWHRAG